jgi:hypothetical protein
MAHPDAPDISHPATARGKVGRRILYFGLVGAALAYSFDQLASYIIAARECALRYATGGPALVRATEPRYLVPLAVCLLIALGAVWAAYTSWQRTRGEHPGGSSQHVAEHGEGRTRFMALCALLTSIGMVLGMVFLFVQMVAVPLCER